jgi:RNAse (barnase) inhibitor barstar
MAAGGFLHAVAADFESEFATRLSQLGFTILAMEPMTESELFDQLGRVFHFPDYYGRSGWDAVNDCFRDVRLADRTALSWRRADEFACRDAKAFGEACCVLREVFDSLGREGKQAEMVLLGSGDSFSRP